MKKNIFLLLALAMLFTSNSTADELQDHLQKGHTLAQEKKYSEAIQEYEEAVKIDPKNMRANLFLGLTYAHTGNFESAVRYANTALQIDRSYASYFYLGLIYALKGEPDKSIESFDQALMLNPTSHDAEYQKGLVFAGQQSYDKARDAYERAVKLNPNFEEARLALATTSYKEGDVSAANRQVEELRNMNKKTLADALERWMRENPA